MVSCQNAERCETENNRCNVTVTTFVQLVASSSTDLDDSLVFGLCVAEASEEREVPTKKKKSITDHYVKNQEWSRAHSEKWNILDLGTPVR